MTQYEDFEDTDGVTSEGEGLLRILFIIQYFIWLPSALAASQTCC